MAGLKVFATCPPSYTASPQIYLREVLDVARWSEAAGCEGILIYTDNGLVDPWLIAQAMITHTERLCPLVAVQPVYMHPYAVAKMVASLGFLHKRRVYLNMVAGGFKNDLESLNDPTPHDERYTRLVEYTKLILDLVRRAAAGDAERAVLPGRERQDDAAARAGTHSGVFVSGSSDAGMAAARQLGALAVRYPNPWPNTRPLQRRMRPRSASASGSSRARKRATRGRWPGHGSPKIAEVSSPISWR